jgi:hypothetical protein
MCHTIVRNLQTKNTNVKFEVFTVVRKTMLFWVLVPCRLVSPPSALKMETVCFSETLASTDESTRRQSSEKHHFQMQMVLKFFIEPVTS